MSNKVTSSASVTSTTAFAYSKLRRNIVRMNGKILAVELLGFAKVAGFASLFGFRDQRAGGALDLESPQTIYGARANERADDEPNQERIIGAILLHVRYLNSFESARRRPGESARCRQAILMSFPLLAVEDKSPGESQPTKAADNSAQLARCEPDCLYDEIPAIPGPGMWQPPAEDPRMKKPRKKRPGNSAIGADQPPNPSRLPTIRACGALFHRICMAFAVNEVTGLPSFTRRLTGKIRLLRQFAGRDTEFGFAVGAVSANSMLIRPALELVRKRPSRHLR